jgi:hypothetical protein
MDTSLPLASLRLLWHRAQFPDPAKWLVENCTSGEPGSYGVVDVVVVLPVHEPAVMINMHNPKLVSALPDFDNAIIDTIPFLPDYYRGTFLLRIIV